MTLPILHTGILRALKLALFLAVLVYVGRELAARLAALPAIATVVAYPQLFAGAALATAASILYVPIYGQMQRALAIRPSPLAPAVVALVSPVGKYLPGKVASLLGAIWIYRRFGVSAGTATGITLLTGAANFAAVSLLLLPFIASGAFQRYDSPWLTWLFPGVWVGGLVLAFPRIFANLLNRVARLAGRPAVALVPRTAPYLSGVAWSGFQLVLMGGAFWFVARAVSPVAVADWYLLTVSLMVAGTLGFFAFFAPAGIGVREGLLLLLLRSVIGDSELALALILLRVNQVLIEGLLALVGLVLWRLFQQDQWPGRKRALKGK